MVYRTRIHVVHSHHYDCRLVVFPTSFDIFSGKTITHWNVIHNNYSFVKFNINFSTIIIIFSSLPPHILFVTESPQSYMRKATTLQFHLTLQQIQQIFLSEWVDVIISYHCCVIFLHILVHVVTLITVYCLPVCRPVGNFEVGNLLPSRR